MPCDTYQRPNQSLEQRKAEVRSTVESLDRQILRRKVRPVVGKNGAIAFSGWAENEKNGVTDACAYRRIMSTGSALARAEIARAEQLAGRTVDRKTIATGIHSHDGGNTWNGKD